MKGVGSLKIMSEHLKSGIQNAVLITNILGRLSQYIFFFFSLEMHHLCC